MSTVKPAKATGSQFAAFLTQAKKPILEPDAPEVQEQENVLLAPPPALSRSKERLGKPLAKRNNPEFRSWTGFLKKESIIDAGARLARGDGSPDLSDLLQGLLESWLAKQ